METKMDLDKIYIPSTGVVAREIEGELIIVPIVSGIGDIEDELYTLNETGKAIWKRLDGKKSLSQIIEDLSQEFESHSVNIEKDVVGFVRELLKRKMLTEAENV